MPIIKRIYIYNDSHLPEDGWIQACFNCNELTSKTILFKTFIKNETLYEFKISICGKCKRKLNNLSSDWLKFNDCCNDYINNNFENLLTS
jgi:hypothetical protein